MTQFRSGIEEGLSKSDPGYRDSWSPDSELPEGGNVCFVGDGFATESPPRFLDLIRSLVDIEVRCFSYSGPGKAYLKIDTNRPFSSLTRVFQKYTFADPEIIGIPFSLAAPIFLMGLAKLEPQNSIQDLILVQPAFAANPERVADQRLSVDVWPLSQLTSKQRQDEILAAAEALVNRGTHIVVLYWDEDAVLSFKDARSNLESKGVEFRQIELNFPPFDPAKHTRARMAELEFIRHCHVPSEGPMKDAIAEALSESLSRQTSI